MNNEALSLIKECYLDPVLFCRTFFPNVFTHNIPWFHRAYMGLLTGNVKFLDQYGDLDKIDEYFRWNDGEPIFDFTAQQIVNGLGRYNCFLLPTEHGRSTLTSLFLPAWNLLYREHPIISYIESYDVEARQSLAVLRRQLTENPRIIGIFGDLGIRSSTTTSSRSDYFELEDGHAIMVAGAYGRVKGITFNNKRSNLIICNDIEHMDFTTDDSKRRKFRNWFYNEVVSDIPIIFFANLKNPESLPVTLERDPDWKVMRLPVVLSNGEALWPEVMTLERIEARRRSLALAGNEIAFRLEYMNENPETASTDFVVEVDAVVESFVERVQMAARMEGIAL